MPETQATALKALVDAVCRWGWAGAPEGAIEASAESAERALADAPAELLRELLPACLAGDAATVRRLLDDNPALVRSPLPPRGWPPLLYLCFSALLERPGPREAATLEVVRLLLALGADPNADYRVVPDPGCGFPALYAAIAVSKSLPLARLLLEAGARPSDSLSLYHAAERFDTEPLDLLYRHGLEAKDISYCLFHQLDFAHDDGIRWFLDHGADPHGRHPAADETPLHWAIKRTCSAASVSLLLDRGADPSARTREGFTAYPRVAAWTPLDLAERLGRREIAAIVEGRGGVRGPRTPADDLAVAAALGDGDRARQLLAEQPDLLSRLREEDRSLMAHVAQQNETAGVELMLELGFDATGGSWGGNTALHWAACRGNRRLVRALLARGVPLVDLGPPAGTPIDQALHHRWNPAGDYDGVLEDLRAAVTGAPPDPGATTSPSRDSR